LLLGGLAVALGFASYTPADPSWDTASGVPTHNLLGAFGATASDLLIQTFGLSAYLLPVLIWVLGWKWLRSTPVHNPLVRVAGSLALWFSLSAACGLLPASISLAGGVRPCGVAGMVLADFLRRSWPSTL
jgi:S-DNA-T family DNA segregation ATPase FtsK/SpoIIIE